MFTPVFHHTVQQNTRKTQQKIYVCLQFFKTKQKIFYLLPELSVMCFVCLASCLPAGLGCGLVYVATLTITCQYFDKRRGLALGIVTTGTDTNPLISPGVHHFSMLTSGGERMVGWALMTCKSFCRKLQPWRFGMILQSSPHCLPLFNKEKATMNCCVSSELAELVYNI